jgi:DNA (cytosine-5)-methyltransferase 1
VISSQFILPLAHELVVDLFAGGGGASTGIEAAIGRHIDIAVNHDPEAISLHEANHPQTRHYVSDVFEVEPMMVTAGQPVGLLWASPDCKHFSKAKGGVPVSKKIRGLAWVVVKWAKAVKPRVICLENVEEFQTWGPLNDENRPCPLRKGETFQLWIGELQSLGYHIEWRELRACDYGAPTIRKRLFLVARRDGMPVAWPSPTHAKPGTLSNAANNLKPWRTAAECIDWSIPCPSIFDRKKPLADATCRRIAKGLVRYVIKAKKPFIAPAQASAFITEFANTSTQRNFAADEPLRTQVAQIKGGHFALVAAFLAKHYTGVVGSDLTDPLATITSVDHHSLVTANLIHMGHGEGRGGGKRFSHGVRCITEPLNTITASGAAAGLVTAFLVKYYSEGGQDQSLADPMHTIPTKDRLGLVTVTIAGESWVIVDIGLRMLTPSELYRAQGFPEGYQFKTGADGRPLTKTAQVRMCGNSVSPPAAKALVEANYFELIEERMAA